ncbi:MAG TPA: hypothetical protein DHW82_04890 [Spirochaetia bacterium]|nr:MAG: hypothetical protein A2Y41_12680 [Spirochaetes bacterium GWB1_36_13]HCL56329.1 hypothetical protein [Spirochaetia bacterium]
MLINKFKELFSKKLKIPLYLNTWNNRIIAREGAVFSKDLLEIAARIGKDFNKVQVKDTFFIKDLEKVLTNEIEKYGFITENLKFLQDILNYVGSISVPEHIISELSFLKERNFYNYHHTVAVTALATRIARDYFFEDENIAELAEMGLVYDIGIAHIPQNIIQKLGRFDDKERNIVNYHPIYSALLIAHYYKDANHPLIDPVLNHHENLDGSGFPRQIKNNNLSSHILKIADKFDALISARPFRKFYYPKDAFKICEDEMNSGKTTPEILSIIYSYYLFIDAYPYK